MVFSVPPPIVYGGEMDALHSDHIHRLRRRAEVVRRIRAFFDRRDYLAVETPRLCPTPIPESHIELFETRRRGPDPETGAQRRPLWLLPSPEVYLKQLLAAGSGSLYEIARSFRNGEVDGPHHAVEFTMLEYYTVDADGDDSIAITEDLLAELGIPGPATRISMADAWLRWCGIDLEATLNADGTGDRSRMIAEITRAGLGTHTGEGDTWEDLFQRVFLTWVEPELPADRPVYLTRYPAAVPTLARRLPGTVWADRWELYLGGVEVANCFGEETDPDRIAAFFHREVAGKTEVGHRVHDVPPDYLRRPRLPRCSGVAMGVDRLVMAVLGSRDIDEVIAFRPDFRYDTASKTDDTKGTPES